MAERPILAAKLSPPHEIAPFDDHIRAAVAAVAAGLAEPGQQIAAMKWIVFNLCGTYRQPYFANSARDTDFALGKRWVGEQISGLANFRAVEKKEPQS